MQHTVLPKAHTDNLLIMWSYLRIPANKQSLFTCRRTTSEHRRVCLDKNMFLFFSVFAVRRCAQVVRLVADTISKFRAFLSRDWGISFAMRSFIYSGQFNSIERLVPRNSSHWNDQSATGTRSQYSVNIQEFEKSVLRVLHNVTAGRVAFLNAFEKPEMTFSRTEYSVLITFSLFFSSSIASRV